MNMQGGGAAGDWTMGVDPMGDKDDSFGAFFNFLMESGRVPPETLHSYIAMANLGSKSEFSDRMKLVDGWLRRGDWEFFAPVNLRYLRLRQVRLQLQHLLTHAGYQNAMTDAEPPDDWSEFEIMLPLPESIGHIEVMEGVRGRLNITVNTIEAIQSSIEKDQSAGYFRDHSRLVEAFKAGTVLSFASIQADLPHFHRRALEFCSVSMQHTRLRHMQAMGARLLADVDLESQSTQRNLQSGFGRHKTAGAQEGNGNAQN